MVGGFRIERLIGVGSTGAVYEATQASLGRSVALRLIPADHFATADELARFDEQQGLMASLHHPNLVPCYATGEWEGGRFVAMRFIRGISLADLQAEGLTPPAAALEPLADALHAAHEVGLVHGAIGANNVLVEESGRSYLTDLGLGRSGTPDADQRALAGVLTDARSSIARRRGRGRTRLLALAAAAVCAAAIGIVIAVGGGADSPPEQIAVPPPAANTTGVGSSLAGTIEPLGCSEVPSANTPACTYAQIRLDGGTLEVRRAGVIRNWVVRGASGAVELQVIRQDKGGSFVAGFTQPVLVDQLAPASFPAEVAVRAGDRVALRLEPGATIGVRRDAPASTIARWDGGLTAESRPSTGQTNDAELMLRADIEYGAHVTPPDQLLGARAAAAPDGRLLSNPPIVLPVSGHPRVAVVEVGGSVAIDVLSDQRLARLEVPDADADGSFLELTPNCGPAVSSGFCFRWQNPGGVRPIEHQYFLGKDGRIKTIG